MAMEGSSVIDRMKLTAAKAEVIMRESAVEIANLRQALKG